MLAAKQESRVTKQFYSGLIRLHILHLAANEGIFGLGIIEELAGHGYKLSPGTLYPLLHALEKDGLLRSEERILAGKIRRVYQATPAGQKVLQAAKEKIRELFGELFDDKRVARLARTRPQGISMQTANNRRQSASKVAR